MNPLIKFVLLLFMGIMLVVVAIQLDMVTNILSDNAIEVGDFAQGGIALWTFFSVAYIIWSEKR